MIKVGCCGFAEARTKYYRKFDLVEIDQTFYQMPLPKTVQRWRQEAGGSFEFTLAAWQLITHPPSSPSYEKIKEPLKQKKLGSYGSFQLTSEVLSAWQRTVEVADALDCRRIVFLSPPSFVPEKTHIDNLTKFFGSVERHGLRMIWEPGRNWPDDLVMSLCRDLDLIHGADLFVRSPLTAPPWYLRLKGKGEAAGAYTDKDLEDLLRGVRNSPETRVVFCHSGMLADATRLKKMIK